MAQQTILISLISSIETLKQPLDPTATQRAVIKRKAALLHGIVGCPSSETQEYWEIVGAVLLNRSWDESIARILVCWISGAGAEEMDYEGD